MSGPPTTTPEQKRRYERSDKGRERVRRYQGSVKGLRQRLEYNIRRRER